MTTDDKMKVLLSYRASYTLVYLPSNNASKPYTIRVSENGLPLRWGRTADEVICGLYNTVWEIMLANVNKHEVKR
jgi:hypothetical protein